MASGCPTGDYYLKDGFAVQRDPIALMRNIAPPDKYPDPAGAASRIWRWKRSWPTRADQGPAARTSQSSTTPVDKAALQALAPISVGRFHRRRIAPDRDRFVATTNTALPKMAAIRAAAPTGTHQGVDGFRVCRHGRALSLGGVRRCLFQFREKTLAARKPRDRAGKRALAAVAAWTASMRRPASGR